MNKSGPKQRPYVISKWTVWEAYQQVRLNKGAAGVDGQSIEDFEKDLENNLYKVWVRMSSGSYFPPPVRAVEIPKPHGQGSRILGVPTVADRVAQTVVALTLQPRTESIFHNDSYGYRPGRSPLMAVGKCRERCWRMDWVLEFDISLFFDSVDHDLVVKAVEANTTPEQKWVVIYVRRWLKAPTVWPDGRTVERDRGTPQGSAVSPVLANLFLHYAFDAWMGREFPTLPFERFADDAVVHCVTEKQARYVRVKLAERMKESGLHLHPDKTRIVYCQDENRREAYGNTSFSFLGYTFRARGARGKGGRTFSSFQPAVSRDALKKMGGVVRRWRIHLRTTDDIATLAAWLNPVIRGWVNYYGEFYRSELYRLLQRINTYLVRWARRKFKRLRSFKKAKRWWNGLICKQPRLFAHWAWCTSF
ncbi:group II intron reverse transcriptase/maturase [Frankia sp. CiP1_Cm_nod2]|uniref:group II intron reverse transcriptase/maturase n=1 Tax=Frankia sp. CiP1_Cm_nod2 TaxID=2897161 RepID=UPI002024C7C4